MDDDGQPPAKRVKIAETDKVISSLLNKLHNGCIRKDDFYGEFEEIVASKNQLNYRQIQSLNVTSRMGENFLMLACLYGNDNAVEFLIKCGLNLHKKDVIGWTASDYAWERKNLKYVMRLLEADAPFPNPDLFDQKLTDIRNCEFEGIMIKIRDFHRNISEGNLEKIKNFVTENPNIRFAYDENNHCALTTALKSNQIEVHTFLRSQFYEAGIDLENHKTELFKLKPEVQEDIRLKLKKRLGKTVEDHIMALLSKSRDRSGSKKNFKTLVDFYEALNEIPQIRPILKLVAKSEQTDIVFDFNDKNCSELDSFYGRTAHGLTYHEEGHIMIGAGREKSKVMSTIAHEFTHWALQLVYKNECKPFKAENNNQKVQYDAIVKKYKKKANRKQKFPEMEVVFNPKAYKPYLISCELIVRVPELLALHKDSPEELKIIQDSYQDLFEFFEKKVLPDFKNELLEMKIRKKIKEINKSSGVLQNARDLNMLSAEFLREITFEKCTQIKTTTPMLVLENIVRKMEINLLISKQSTKEIEGENIFVEVEQFFSSESFEKLKKFAESVVKAKIFVVDKRNYFGGESIDEKLIDKIYEIKAILIFTTLEGSLKNKLGSVTEINFEWKDLNEEAKAKVKQDEIIFQDNKVRVDEILKNVELLEKLPLGMVLSPFSVKLKSLNRILPESLQVYIKRRFRSKDKIHVDLCGFLSNNKSVLIADSAGMGKSTSAAQLARDIKTRNKYSWVVFVDLKQHTKVFVHDSIAVGCGRDQKSHSEIDLSYFTKKLLKLETFFERELFGSFFRNKQVIFIIDGFDEISPKYKDFVLKILKVIKSSENRLLVTTRPHFTEMLKTELVMEVVEIEPFDKSDQIEYLIKSWKLNSNDVDLAKELLRKLESSLKLEDFWSTPIHIFMLSEVFPDLKNIEDFDPNFFELYEKFIKLKEKIWADEKGPLAKEDNLELLNTFPATNLKQIFYRLAIEQIFSPEKADELKIPKVDENVIDETIARVGIVAFDSNGFERFTHRTYAEFFVADLIANQVFKKNPQYEFVELFAEIILKDGNFEKIWELLIAKLVKIDEFDTEVLSIHFETIAAKFKSFSSSSPNKKSPRFIKLFSFILENLIFNIKLKRKIFSFMLEIFPRNFEYVIMGWRFFQKIQKGQEFLDEYLSDRSQLKEILCSALRHEEEIKSNESEQLLQQLIEYAGKVFKEKDFMNFYFDKERKFLYVDEFIYCSSIDNFASFEKIWAAAEKKLSRENIKKIVLGREKDGDTMLHMIAWYNSKYLLKWLKNIKNSLDNEEFERHLMIVGNADDMFIQTMLRNENLTKEDFEQIWEFIEQNSREETQKKLLFHECEIVKREKILIELSVTQKDKSLVDYIFDITDSILLRTEKKTLIDFLRPRGSLDDVILNMIVASTELFDKYSSKFKPEEFRSILLIRDFFKWRVLRFFVRTNNRISIWNRIVDEINDLNEVKRLLLDGDEHNSNFAAHLNNNFLIELLEWCEKVFDHEFLESVFTAQDWNQNTLLHNVARFSDEDLYRKCFEFFSKHIQSEKQREILRMENKEGDLLIQTTLLYKNEENGETTANFYFELFEADGIKKLFSEMKFSKPIEENSSIKRIVNNLQMRSVLENYCQIEKLNRMFS